MVIRSWMFGLIFFLRNIVLRYAKKRNCLFLTSSFLTSGTRPAQVPGQLLPCAEKAVPLQRDSERQIALTIPSALSPKWVPSKSHFLADKDGRKEGGGFRRIQKTHINATAYGLLTKFLTLDYPILWAGIAWRLLREICVSSRRQQLLPPRGSKFRVVMARCQNL